MRRIRKFLLAKWVYVVFFVIWLSIVVMNRLEGGQWLLGYDNLVPELNFSLNLERNSTMYQHYRGMGVATSVADAAELTRMPFVWVVMTIWGAQYVRWAWTMVMILAGGWGAIVLTKELLKRWQSKTGVSGAGKAAMMGKAGRKKGERGVEVLALMVGLVYVFNPSTIQNFYSPLEAFASWFGFLPWIIYFYNRFLTSRKRVGLAGLALMVVSLAASSAFYIQTMFIVLLMVLGVMGLLSKKIKRAAVGLGLVVAANAFWFLPLAVTTVTMSGGDVFESQQNVISTPEVQLLGQTFGDIGSIATLHGYWFGQTNYDIWQTYPQVYLGEWQDRLNSWWALGWGWVIWGGAVAGYGWSLAKEKKKMPILGAGMVMLMSMMMLTSGRGILGWPFAMLSRIDLWAQIFRVAFTKWAAMAGLFYGIGWALLWLQIGKKARKLNWVGMGVTIAMSTLVFWPLWRGLLFAPQVRVELPDSYLAARDFLAEQDTSARLMYLPSSNMWGWFYYDWGYRGSGFVWQMMPQAVMDRNFDVWSLENEDFTKQLNHALQRRDGELMRTLAAKYQTRYALLDYSLLLQTGKENSISEIDEIGYLLEKSGAEKIWQQDQLMIFDFGVLTLDESKNHVVYPFAYLRENDWASELSEPREIELEAQLDIEQETELRLPVLAEGSDYRAEMAITYERGRLIFNFYPQIWLKINQRAQRFISLPERIERPIEAQGEAVLLMADERRRGEENPFARQQKIDEGQTVNFSLPLTVGQHLEFLVAEVDEVYRGEGEELIIDGHRLEPVMIRGEELWSGVSEEKTALLYPTNEVSLIVEPLWQEVELGAEIVGCDSLERGDNYLYPQTESLLYGSYKYGAGCSTFFLPTTSGEWDYLLSIDAKNYMGRAFKIYVHDAQAAQNPVLERLLDKDKLHHHYFLGASARLDKKMEERSLSLWVENRSFGMEAKNELYSVKVARLPLGLLAQAELMGGEAVVREEGKPSGWGQVLFWVGIGGGVGVVITISFVHFGPSTRSKGRL